MKPRKKEARGGRKDGPQTMGTALVCVPNAPTNLAGDLAVPSSTPGLIVKAKVKDGECTWSRATCGGRTSSKCSNTWREHVKNRGAGDNEGGGFP